MSMLRITSYKKYFDHSSSPSGMLRSVRVVRQFSFWLSSTAFSFSAGKQLRHPLLKPGEQWTYSTYWCDFLRRMAFHHDFFPLKSRVTRESFRHSFNEVISSKRIAAPLLGGSKKKSLSPASSISSVLSVVVRGDGGSCQRKTVVLRIVLHTKKKQRQNQIRVLRFNAGRSFFVTMRRKTLRNTDDPWFSNTYQCS